LRKKRVSDDDAAADLIRSGGFTRTQQDLNDFKGGGRIREAVNNDSF